MRSLTFAILPSLIAIAFSAVGCTQGTLHIPEFTADQESHDIIPDKVFELGLPLLILLFVMNSLISILKNRADNQLRTKAIERGISEDALIRLFRSGEQISTMQPLKWFLLTLSIGISLITIHFLRPYLGSESEYLAVGIILTLASTAFYIYYAILKNKFKP